MKLPARVLSSTLKTSNGDPAIKIEGIKIAKGEKICIEFENFREGWRQGIWLATHGLLLAAGLNAPQLHLWTDTAPKHVEIEIIETDGLLRFYNIWDSHRGLAPESQSASSGMFTEQLGTGITRYRCNDIGLPATYSALTFQLSLLS